MKCMLKIRNMYYELAQYNVSYMYTLNRVHAATTIVPLKQENSNVETIMVVGVKAIVMPAPQHVPCRS